jgi:MoaA/NifB/PqqE/SkfB family radical SAM enzyme
MLADPRDRHAQRLRRWQDRHPTSGHLLLGADELEALKAENDRLSERDRRERPEVCSGYPSFVTVGNTHKCNLTCQMCFKQLDDVENMTLPDMGLERFERVAHELFPHLRTVALSVTGEPLVSRTILEELELLATYGVRASITSNGMPLSKAGLIEALLPVTEALVVSLDGASAPVFDAIRRRADFHKVLRNVRAFAAARDALPVGEHRPRLHVNHILQHRNLTELPRLVELAHALRVDHVNVEHVYVHEGLNPEDTVLPYPRLANRMLAEARAVADRLGVALDLPEPFDTASAAPDLPYAPVPEDRLRAQAKERLASATFDPLIHERWDEQRRHKALVETGAAGGGNREYVERLLDERALLGHLRYGVPQLGPSLIPAAERKVSACAYAWGESFIEYNGIVAPCCNPAVDAARVLGHLDQAPSFRDIWNGPAYRALRRSLTSGDCYRFCRTCYLYEPPSEADWGTNETWIRVRASLPEGQPVEVGRVPPGKRVVLRELASGAVPAAARVLVLADGQQVAELAPARANGACAFAGPLPAPVELGREAVVQLVLRGGAPAAPLDIGLIAFVL